TNFTYRISPQYRITQGTMAYFTYSTGYKGPGVAFISGLTDPYQAETVRSYELGIKSELLERRLRLNVDLFNEHDKDCEAQVSKAIRGLPNFVIGNAGGLTSRGVESDFSFRPIEQLTFNGALTYNEAWFTEYIDGPNVYTGNNLTNAPRWAGSLMT